MRLYQYEGHGSPFLLFNEGYIWKQKIRERGESFNFPRICISFPSHFQNTYFSWQFLPFSILKCSSKSLDKLVEKSKVSVFLIKENHKNSFRLS